MNENDKGSNNRNSSRRRTKEFTFENEQEEEEQGRGLQKTTDRWGFLRSKLKKRPTNDDEDGTVDGEDGNLTDVDENESYKMCDCIEKTKPDIIPFKTVYDPLDEVPVEDRVYFVPGVPVKATIVAARRDTDHVINVFSQYFYTIKLEHQGQIWYVERKYVDFQRLANRLALFKATQVVSAPFSWHRSAESPSASGQHLPKTTQCLAYDQCDGLICENIHFAQPSVADQFFSRINFDEPHHRQGTSSDPSAAEPPQDVPFADQTSIPSPRQATIPQSSDNKRKIRLRAHRWPRLPFKPEAWIGYEDVPTRKEELQRYIASVLHFPALRNHKETVQFLDVSRLSFVYNLEHKWKEGLIVKKPGGHFGFKSINFNNCKKSCAETCHCKEWYHRWAVIKDTFLGYLHPGTDMVREVMLFDNHFATKITTAPGRGMSHAVLVTNMSRELLIQCKTEFEAISWKDNIDKAVSANLGAEWRIYHPFGSSYPQRENSYAHWLVDGKSYMEQLAHAMECAKEEIFIAGWFITAELYMKRPPRKNDPWQLMEILKRKAEQGVHCCVLFYKEFQTLMDNGSSYAKRVLKSLHPRIIVARHPDHAPVPVLWAHHEKIAIVDQSIAFAGGIDVSYGRWDDHHHHLTDVGRAFKAHPGVYDGTDAPRPSDDGAGAGTGDVASPDEIRMKFGDRTTYSNYYNGQNIQISSDREKSIISIGAPDRNGSNDVEMKPISNVRESSNGIKIEEMNDAQVQDDARDEKLAELDKLIAFIKSGKREEIRGRLDTPPKHAMERMKRAFAEWRVKSSNHDPRNWHKEYEQIIEDIDALKDMCLDRASGELWVGKDYTNWYKGYVTGYELPYIDQWDRKSVPRTPWHDVSCVVYGAAARDLARHFIQRWNMCKEEKFNDKDEIPFLVPKSYVNIKIPEYFKSKAFNCKTQVLRSVYKWSAGVSTVEDSIHRAYEQLILKAEHFIYIENQFFVTLIDHEYVKNQIANALFKRIVKAHKNNEKFRVFVFMPPVPAFEGELGERSGIQVQAMLFHAYASINRSKQSLLTNLEREVGDTSKYIQFYALRTFAELGGKLISDHVYIHTKAMNVDDKYSLIGSANINDRSLAGDRDSEVAFYIEDTQFVQSTMNGRPFLAGKFGQSFRKRLMGEHLGILDINSERIAVALEGLDLDDPISEKFWTNFKATAVKNTQIHDEVFKCYPSDNVKNWEDLKRYKLEAQQSVPAVTDRRRAEKLLAGLQGFLVEFPTKFMDGVNLAPDKGLIPDAWQYPVT